MNVCQTLISTEVKKSASFHVDDNRGLAVLTMLYRY